MAFSSALKPSWCEQCPLMGVACVAVRNAGSALVDFLIYADRAMKGIPYSF